jgi:prevent-host-death family protein
MTTVGVTRARKELFELLNRCRFGRERFTIYRHGSPAAVLISLADLQNLEKNRPAPETVHPTSPATTGPGVVGG